MSNYLERLAARTFRPAEAVQPRLPFLFEPVAPMPARAENTEPVPQLGRAIERPEEKAARKAAREPEVHFEVPRPRQPEAHTPPVPLKTETHTALVQAEGLRERVQAALPPAAVHAAVHANIAPLYTPPDTALWQPRAEAKPAASQSNRIQLPATQPAPSAPIRIHIGRVEVRAIAPAPPPPRTETPVSRSAVIPLQDYLKQRKEERG